MVLGLPVLSHYLRKRQSLMRFINYVLLGIYLLANLYLTLLSRRIGSSQKLMLTPLWSYRAALDQADVREEVLLNILLYVPLGYLLHYAFPGLHWRTVVLIGFLLSLCTEVTQYMLGLGVCEVDDLISNTLGTVIGVLAYKGFKKIASS